MGEEQGSREEGQRGRGGGLPRVPLYPLAAEVSAGVPAGFLAGSDLLLPILLLHTPDLG